MRAPTACEEATTISDYIDKDDAAAMVLHLHGRILRLVARQTGTHFTGLGQIARRGKWSARTARRLKQVDAAAALLRHITMPSCEALLHAIQHELDQRDKGDEQSAENV